MRYALSIVAVLVLVWVSSLDSDTQDFIGLLAGFFLLMVASLFVLGWAIGTLVEDYERRRRR